LKFEVGLRKVLPHAMRMATPLHTAKSSAGTDTAPVAALKAYTLPSRRQHALGPQGGSGHGHRVSLQRGTAVAAAAAAQMLGDVQSALQ
jgi:hypothetical protein